MAATFARMAIGAAGGLFEATVRSASHLGETMNKVKVVLGDSSAKIIANADDMADRFGLVRKEIIDAGSSFALLGKEMGMTGNESADFGVKLTRLAANATSLSDIPMDRMLEKLRSGLAGQVRPLRELGIFMTADAVKAQAAQMGLKPGASGQLSEGDKIRARVSFIENSEFMRKAAGDLERTLGSTENQTRKFWGTLTNLGTAIGQELDPAWNKLLQSFNTGLDDLKGYFEANKSMVRGWGDSVVEGFNTAKVVWRNLPDVINIALLGADVHMQTAKSKIEIWATETAVSIEKAFLNASKKVAGFFANMQTGVNAIIGKQVGEFQEGFAELKTSAGKASKAFDAAVGAVAFRADVAFRPIRDATNAIERAAGAGNYKQMSVEEDIGRLKGSLSGLAPGLGKIEQFLGIYKENLAIPVKPRDQEETALIDKADKHLAEVWAQQAKRIEESRKGIAALEEKMARQETARLNALANQWVEDTEYDKMFPPATKPGRGGGKGGGGAAEEVATKHEKTITDTMSFMANLQAANLGGNVQDKQLSELQKIRELDQKNAEMMERMLNQRGMAVFG